MKKFFSFSILLLIFSSQIIAQNWKWINPDPTGDDLNGMCFTDGETGHFAGMKGTILQTWNAGSTWENRNMATLDTFNAIHFPVHDTGYAVGNNGSAYKTSDGGTSWVPISTGTAKDLNTVFFSSSLTGYAAGMEGIIIKTTDGGETWTDISIQPYHRWYCMWFTSNDKGFIGGSFGLYKTEDGGATWQQINVRYSDYLGMYFSGPDTGYVVGADTCCVIYKTVNGGNTWTFNVNASQIHYFTPRAVHFPSGSTGYAVGYEGKFIRTTDGGNTWTLGTTGSPYMLSSVWFSSPETGFVCGEHGLLLKTFNKGNSWGRLYQQLPLRDIRDVYFTDENHGHAAGRFFGSMDTCGFLKTSDGGLTWSFIPTHQRGSLSAIQFPTADVGYSVGWNVIFKTTDAGETWSTIGNFQNYDLTSVWFTDENNGVAVGNPGVLLHTTDGGINWDYRFLGTFNWCFGVHFPSPTTGYICGSGLLLKSIDGGATWNYINAPTQYDLYTIFFVDENTGFTGGGSIYKTTDGGLTWNLSFSGPDYIKKIFFLDPSTGYATGENGSIWCTTNGGASWERQLSPAMYPLESIFFTSNSVGIAVGGDAILRTTNGGGVGIASSSDQKKELIIYPNPSSSFVQVQLPDQESPWNLSFVDLQGKVIATRDVTGFKAEIDVSGWSKGMYFIKAVSGEKVMTGKMVKW